MVLALRYGDLSGTISESDKLARELGQYCDGLSRKVQQKMYSVEGGMSAALNNADYYINQKIKNLRARENNARNLSARVQNLLETARRVDTDVERTIQANQRAFFRENPELKASRFKMGVTSFLCDMKNVPILGWMIRGGEQMLSAADQLIKDVKHSWKCGGGKELIMNCLNIVIKIGLAVAAVLEAVGAIAAITAATVVTFGAVLVAVAASVAAVIAVVNAGANVATSLQAIKAGRDGNPAMARIYGERDTLAQVIREENFHNRFLNRLSMISANILDITDKAANIALLARSIGKIVGGFLGKNGVGFAFKTYVRDPNGKLVKTVTPGSIWKGTKAMLLNQKLTMGTSAGLRTTLLTNIKQSFMYQGTMFKLALRDPIKWIKTKKIGDMGFFKNMAEKMRYGTWQLKNSAFQLRPNDIKFNVEKISTLVTGVNDVFSYTKLVFEGFDRADGKGFIRRGSEKFVQKTFFDNDFTKLLDKTGLGGVLAGFDKSGTLKDYTGMGNGIIQKSGDIIEKKIENINIIQQNIADLRKVLKTPLAPVSFKVLYPYYLCDE